MPDDRDTEGGKCLCIKGTKSHLFGMAGKAGWDFEIRISLREYLSMKIKTIQLCHQRNSALI